VVSDCLHVPGLHALRVRMLTTVCMQSCACNRVHAIVCMLTCAIWIGTTSSSMPIFGSGEMTVRPEKSTRLPLRLPRKRPCLPLSRWAKARIGRFSECHSGRTLGTLGPLMYMAHWSCR
jgi:hypothetical protein